MLTGAALALAGILAARLLLLKKKVYEFAAKLESGLDDIAAGREMRLSFEAYEDTLWGKLGEKLQRLGTACKWDREESKREREQVKELISDISHQTKTPVANLKVYLEMLQDELADSGACNASMQSFLRRMEVEANKLDFLMQNMVKMSRLETGVIQIRIERDNLFQTLRAAVAAAVPKAEKKQIQLSVECEDPVWICHDRKWTQEALFNIIDNAVKYTDAAGAVRIGVVRQEIYTKISIRDTGRGIPLSRQAEVFKRFYREPEVHGQEGIGVGLYLARKIIEMQGGYLEVTSEPGRGSDFQVFLQNETLK